MQDHRVSTRETVERSRAVLRPVGQVRPRARTSDRVYQELVFAIRDLRIPPGTSLSETELAEDLHVSRTPVREAIVRLVDNGLVSVVPQVGTRVEPIRLRDVEEAHFIRESLELSAFAAACTQPIRDVGTLRVLIEEQGRSHARSDLDAVFEGDEALHARIFTIAGHPGAWRVLQPAKLQLDRVRRLSLPEQSTIRELIGEHVAIVDALEAGDARRGCDHLRRHIRRVLDYGPALRTRHPQYFAD